MEEAAAGKAQLPTVESLTDGTMRRFVAAEPPYKVCRRSRVGSSRQFLEAWPLEGVDGTGTHCLFYTPLVFLGNC